MELYLLLLCFATLLPVSFSFANDNYTTCSGNFKCGSIDGIGYPFYDGSSRPDYCGYPGFELDCSQDTPKINISNQAYDFKGIGTEAYSIKVSRTDSWTDLCPETLANTTIDYSKFNFTSADQNITFLYDCVQNDALSSLYLKPTCEGDGLAYYLTQAMVNQQPTLLHICKHLFLPVLESSAKIIDTYPNNSEYVINALEAGFELDLTADNDACRSCVKSGGECGHDPDSDSKNFICHCHDADYNNKCKGKNRTAIIIGVSVGAVVLLALLGVALLCVCRRRKQLVAQQKSRGIFAIPDSLNDGGGPHASTPGSNGLTSSQGYTYTPSTYSQSNASYMSSQSDIGRSHLGVHLFEYTELEHATNYFDESKELGDGGFGTVYYGVLPDGRQVAVKRLYENSLKRVGQFMNEIKILAEIKHKNLVALYGHTSKKSRELLLVYEYIANGTVADHLHGKLSETSFLRWPNRLNIAVETAEALAFLHRNDVIHRDVKTTNILLDEHFHVKVADFGLSRLFPTDMTHVSTAPQGTPGYVDPEYYQCYRLTEKSDVYSFGVVLIELISSKHAVDITRHRHDVNLASMAVDRIQNCALHELVDPRLDFDKDQAVQAMVKMVAELGFQCLQQDRDMRPTMDEVLVRLKAVQSEGLKDQKQEVIVYSDDVGLLSNPTPPLSPDLPRSNDIV